MEAARQIAMSANYMSSACGMTVVNAEGHLRQQCPVLVFACGSHSTRRGVAVGLCNAASTRKSVVSNSSRSRKDKHGHDISPDEAYGPFPEALLLKKKNIEHIGQPLPEFADVDEEELLTSLSLQLESAMDFETARHYEIMYLIHENNANEVQDIITKVKDFINERKGKIWRLNDWGMRRLAYKIKKAKKANYILMNIELGSEAIDDLKTLLDKDERIIRHLVMKQKKAITEDCPPPPEYKSRSTESDDEEVEGSEDESQLESEGELEEESEGGFNDELENNVEKNIKELSRRQLQSI